MRIQLRREVRKPAPTAVVAKRAEAKPTRATTMLGIAPNAVAKFSSVPVAPSRFEVQAQKPPTPELKQADLPSLLERVWVRLTHMFDEVKRPSPTGGDKQCNGGGINTM